MKNRAASIARDSKGTANAPHGPLRATSAARPVSAVAGSLGENPPGAGTGFSADDRDHDQLFEENAVM